MIGSVTDLQAQMLAAEKGRRKRMERERQAALTAAHQVAQAEMDEGGEPGQNARKGRADRGITGGPDRFTEPAAPAEPGAFRRGYLDQGHAAPSPMYGPPNQAPLLPDARGIVTQIQLPAAAVVAGSGPGVQSLIQFQARIGLATPVPQPPGGGE